jgi:uncharacterized repeat protein (TIGR03803 family)
MSAALATATAQGQTERVLYKFDKVQGEYPAGTLIRDSDGNLYGTTAYGGESNAGVIFRLDTKGVYTVLYAFDGHANPLDGVIRDAAGNLYGTTYYGGTGNGGIVFKLDTSGNLTALHSFAMDGYYPAAGVISDSAGNLYGTAKAGGTGSAGVVYKVDTANNYTVLYNFIGAADGRQPVAGLFQDSAGNLYGTASEGGTSGNGVVFKLDTSGLETVLYTFSGAPDGRYPDSSLIRDRAGNFYGTTQVGGAADSGVVFKLSKDGVLNVLHAFAGGDLGGDPVGGVIRDSAGNLYGVAASGGIDNEGLVYELDAAGNYTILYEFTGGADGGAPQAGLVRTSKGVLYGTASGGGKRSRGVIFKITPQ